MLAMGDQRLRVTNPKTWIVLEICKGFQLEKVKHEMCNAFILVVLHQIPYFFSRLKFIFIYKDIKIIG
jgi:hypothetical protein